MDDDYTYERVDDLTQYCDELGRVLPEYRDKEFWVKDIGDYCKSRLVGVDDSAVVMPKPKPIPIPSCVPDGWWVFLVLTIGGDRYWRASSNEPTLFPKFGFTCGSGHDNATLDEVLFPELYAWDGPIEQACVQVDRSNACPDRDWETG